MNQADNKNTTSKRHSLRTYQTFNSVVL